MGCLQVESEKSPEVVSRVVVNCRVKLSYSTKSRRRRAGALEEARAEALERAPSTRDQVSATASRLVGSESLN